MQRNDKPRSRRAFEGKQRHIRANRNARMWDEAIRIDRIINAAAVRPVAVGETAPDVVAARGDLERVARRRSQAVRRGS